MKTKLFSALLVLLITPSALFSAESPFTRLQQQINQLQAEIDQLSTVSDQQETRITYLESLPKLPAVVDSMSNVVGTTLGTRLDDAGGLNWFNAEILLFTNSQAFVVKITRDNFDDLATVYFSDANCNGMAFLEVLNSSTGIILP